MELSQKLTFFTMGHYWNFVNKGTDFPLFSVFWPWKFLSFKYMATMEKKITKWLNHFKKCLQPTL